MYVTNKKNTFYCLMNCAESRNQHHSSCFVLYDLEPNKMPYKPYSEKALLEG